MFFEPPHNRLWQYNFEHLIVSSNGEKEYVTVKETVNVRAGQSQESDKVGVAYQGDRLELIMELADGWCKIKYNGETAYVKSEFVE